MDTGRPVDGGIEFGPTPNGKMYISMSAHRGARHKKSCWAEPISPQVEYSLFLKSDLGDWTDEKAYWSFNDQDGRVPLGNDDERLSKHPNPSNADFDPWHGYPASPRNNIGDCPSAHLIRRLLDAKAITRTFARRILERKI